jgi:hypothetical protein
MSNITIKQVIKEELNKSDEARVKKLARDEFDKSIKKHLNSDALEKVVSDLVIKNLKKDKPTKKEVAKITKDVLTKLYKVLWTKNNFWSNGLENI